MPYTNTLISDLVPSEKGLRPTVDFRIAAKNEFLNAGVMQSSTALQSLAGAGPRKFTIQYLNALAADEVNVASDDLNQDGKNGSRTAGEFDAVKHVLNYAWGVTDLEKMVVGDDSMADIGNGIGEYWAKIIKDMAVETLVGVRNATGTNLVQATAAAVTADNLLGAAIDAQAAKGERGPDMMDTLVVSPAMYAMLRNAQGNAFIAKQATNINFDTYAGFKLVVSSRVADLSATGFQNAILIGQGALSYAVGNGPVPEEIERLANKGNGEGGDLLHSRRNVIIHPQGFGYTGSVLSGVYKAGLSTALKAAGSWALEVPKEDVAVSFLRFTVA